MAPFFASHGGQSWKGLFHASSQRVCSIFLREGGRNGGEGVGGCVRGKEGAST